MTSLSFIFPLLSKYRTQSRTFRNGTFRKRSPIHSGGGDAGENNGQAAHHAPTRYKPIPNRGRGARGGNARLTFCIAGPDQVMQLAEARAPGGFRHVHDVIGQAALEAIPAPYKQTAGFAKAQVNRKLP